MKANLIVSAIIRRDDQILMIQQPGETGPYWFIPGGVAEPGELITEALAREVHEETGLLIEQHGQLAFVAQVAGRDPDIHTTAFGLEILHYSGDLRPDDPDALIYDVAFVPVDDAVRRLDHVPWAPMREPLQTYLLGAVSLRSLWQYRQRGENTFDLIARFPEK